MDAIKAYLDKIKNIPVLSEQEEKDLIRKAKRGNLKARRKLINSNLKLVVNIAKHYSNINLSLMDLIAEGNIGLMRAIDKFNLKKGFRFSTYAAWWIRQAITRAIIDQGKTIRIPVYMSEFIAKYKKAREKLCQKLSREPRRREIAKKLKMSPEKVAEIEMWMSRKVSLETPVGEDGESQLGDFIKGKDYADTTLEINRLFEQERLVHLFSYLNEREKEVLSLRFGMSDGKTHTLAAIARKLKVSRERIRQIENEALEKLRKYARKELEEEMEA